ncbi:hypothetical protein KPH14_008626 [Odynerus spinipes]|uniref:phospholipase A2 n=1 Tax=Odynerus spinipes TaxID=1348599 RepID=A0AAD9RT21_9HYME|nr:hypothetical protein KPH14_008626 [Odynerus spinipes]
MSGKFTILVFLIFVGYVPINLIYGINREQALFDASVYGTAMTLITSTQPPTVKGTLWCGHDKVAESYNDIGPAEQTDKCCREWHNCDDFIPPKGSKYGLQNDAAFKVLLCHCNKMFQECLENVTGMEATTAMQILHGYFKAINPKCLKKLYYNRTCAVPYYDEQGNQYPDNPNTEYFCPVLV